MQNIMHRKMMYNLYTNILFIPLLVSLYKVNGIVLKTTFMESFNRTDELLRATRTLPQVSQTEYDPNDDWEIVRKGYSCGSLRMNKSLEQYIYNFNYKGLDDLVSATTSVQEESTYNKTEDPPIINDKEQETYNILSENVTSIDIFNGDNIDTSDDVIHLLSKLNEDMQLSTARGYTSKVQVLIDNDEALFEVESLDKFLMVLAKQLAVNLLTWDEFTQDYLYTVFDEYAKLDNTSEMEIKELKTYFPLLWVNAKDYQTQMDNIDSVWSDIQMFIYYLDLLINEVHQEVFDYKVSDGTVSAIYETFIEVVENTTFSKALELVTTDIITLNWILHTVYVSKVNETNLLKVLNVIDVATDLMYLAKINNKTESRDIMEAYLDEIINTDLKDAKLKPLGDFVSLGTMESLVKSNSNIVRQRSDANTVENIKTIIVMFGIWDRVHNLFEKVMLDGQRGANMFDFPGLKFLRVCDTIALINQVLLNISLTNHITSETQTQFEDIDTKLDNMYLQLQTNSYNLISKPAQLADATFQAIWYEFNHITKFSKDTRFENAWDKIQILTRKLDIITDFVDKDDESGENKQVIHFYQFQRPKRPNYKLWNSFTKNGLDALELYHLSNIRYGMKPLPNLFNSSVLQPVVEKQIDIDTVTREDAADDDAEYDVVDSDEYDDLVLDLTTPSTTTTESPHYFRFSPGVPREFAKFPADHNAENYDYDYGDSDQTFDI